MFSAFLKIIEILKNIFKGKTGLNKHNVFVESKRVLL